MNKGITIDCKDRERTDSLNAVSREKSAVTKLSCIELCVFDFDDTLFRTRECKVQAIKALAERYYDKELSSELIESRWGIAHRDLFEHVLEIVFRARIYWRGWAPRIRYIAPKMTFFDK